MFVRGFTKTAIRKMADLDPVKVQQFKKGFSSGGPSLSQGWQNIKNEIGGLFGGSNSPGASAINTAK